jgi:hypothetical protein
MDVARMEDVLTDLTVADADRVVPCAGYMLSPQGHMRKPIWISCHAWSILKRTISIAIFWRQCDGQCLGSSSVTNFSAYGRTCRSTQAEARVAPRILLADNGFQMSFRHSRAETNTYVVQECDHHMQHVHIRPSIAEMSCLARRIW